MNLRGARVAVTGATGFLGRYIVDALLGRGAHVIGVVRNPGKLPELLQKGVELRQADLSAPAHLKQAFAGVEAVVSNAALLSLGRARWESLLQANVEGTQNVFEAMSEAGVGRAIQVSTVAVYRYRRGVVIREDHPLREADERITRFNAYGNSKARSERLARELAQAHGIALTVVRPSGVYGAFDQGGFTHTFKRLISLPITLYPVGISSGLVYAGDVAEAIVLALEQPASAGKAYNVTGSDETFWEFARAWKRAGGKSSWLMLPVPVPSRRCYDNRQARKELGWTLRSFEEGCRDMWRLEQA